MPEAPPFPEQRDRDEHREAQRRVERDQPARRHGIVHEPQVEMLVSPDEVGVENLLVGQQRNGHHGDEDAEREHPRLVLATEIPRQEQVERRHQHDRGDRSHQPRREQDSRDQKPGDDERRDADCSGNDAGDQLRPVPVRHRQVRRQPFLARHVDDQPQHHHHPGTAEAVMPADLLPERAGDERRGNDADVDEDVEDLERHRPPQVLLAVQLADLGRDIALEQPDADDERQEREQERPFEGHQKMPERHHQRSRDQRDPSAGELVRDDPAEDRHQVNERGVIAEDRRGERLGFQPGIMPAAQPGEARDLVDVARQQEIIDHVEREQRLHGII